MYCIYTIRIDNSLFESAVFDLTSWGIIFMNKISLLILALNLNRTVKSLKNGDMPACNSWVQESKELPGEISI